MIPYVVATLFAAASARNRSDQSCCRHDFPPGQKNAHRSTAGRWRLSGGSVHVWATPAMQGEFSVQRAGQVQPCIRPVRAARMAAGPDV